MPPGLEFPIGPYTLSLNVFIPTIVLLLFLVAVGAYPFFEAWVTGDKREHHMTDRPRNAPTRTAIGAAGVTFYAALWAAASSDILATHFNMSVEWVTHIIQFALIVGPFIAYFLTKRICIGLQKKDREIALHGFESGRIVRLPGGEYIEVHRQLSEYERWRLLTYDDYQPLMLRPNERGRITTAARLRARMSRWFFEDRIAPVTKGELEAAHQHGEH
jgi:ubiquinol-cytochrome c reductase cytochrome b subunit